MRTLFDIFAQIFRNLWSHKLRSFLTMFGIAWGVGSLLLLVGVGEGFRSGNKRELAEFGRNIMFLFPGRAPAVKGSMNSARPYLLTYEDYVDIRTQAPHVGNACPMLSRTDLHQVSEFASASVEILGVVGMQVDVGVRRRQRAGNARQVQFQTTKTRSFLGRHCELTGRRKAPPGRSKKAPTSRNGQAQVVWRLRSGC